MTIPQFRPRAIRLSAVAAAVALLSCYQPTIATAASGPLTWTFEKCATGPGTWEGTATGPDGVTEPLRTQLTSIRTTGQISHIQLDWEVGDTFLAPLTGTLNPVTGAVVMNGRVAEGAYAGSRVHEEGQQFDAARSCFAGTIRIMPASG